MKFEFQEAKLGSILGLTDDIKNDYDRFSNTLNTIKFLWNRNREPLVLEIDGFIIELLPNQIVTVTYLQQVSFKKTALPITAFLFNWAFYGIADHDNEVLCNGVLFFGTQDIPLITIPEDQNKKFDVLHDVFIEEFSTSDKIRRNDSNAFKTIAYYKHALGKRTINIERT